MLHRHRRVAGALLVLLFAAWTAASAQGAGGPVAPGELSALLPDRLAGFERTRSYHGYRRGTPGAWAHYEKTGAGEISLTLARARNAKERFDWRVDYRLRMRDEIESGEIAGRDAFFRPGTYPMAAVEVGGQLVLFATGGKKAGIPVLRKALAALDLDRIAALAERDGAHAPEPMPAVDPAALATLLPERLAGLSRAARQATHDDGSAIAQARYGGEKRRIQVRLADYRAARGLFAGRAEAAAASGKAEKRERGGLIVYSGEMRRRATVIAAAPDYRFGIHLIGQGVDAAALVDALESFDLAALETAVPELPASRDYRGAFEKHRITLTYPGDWFLFEVGRGSGRIRSVVLARAPVPPKRILSAGPDTALGDNAVAIVTALPNPDGIAPRAWLGDKLTPPKMVGGARRTAGPEAVALGGLEGAQTVFEGTDGAGREIVNRHMMFDIGEGRMLHIHTLRPADAPAATRERIDEVLAELRIQGEV